MSMGNSLEANIVKQWFDTLMGLDRKDIFLETCHSGGHFWGPKCHKIDFRVLDGTGLSETIDVYFCGVVDSVVWDGELGAKGG